MYLISYNYITVGQYLVEIFELLKYLEIFEMLIVTLTCLYSIKDKSTFMYCVKKIKVLLHCVIALIIELIKTIICVG